MKRYLFTALIWLFSITPAFAKANVVTTLTWIESIAKEIGKDKIDVTSLIRPGQDPHFSEAKPSMILAARKADILMYNGLDLEIAYLPRIIESSNNRKIQPGENGNFDCSQFIAPIEKPTSFDRSMGDIHPLGNPHYQFSPENIFKVAEGMAEALSAIDNSNAEFYKGNLNSFKERFKERQKQWNSIPLKGKRFISYHKIFEYLAAEYGFSIIGYIEPKPGIPPSAGHITGLIETAGKLKPDAIIATENYGKKEAEAFSQKTGVKVIFLPNDVGAGDTAKDWFTFMDITLESLK